MKKYLVPILIAASSLSLYMCSSNTTTTSSTPVAPNVSEEIVNEAKKTYASANLQTLTQGYTIYTTKCNTCHKLFPVQGRSEESWKHEIDDMSPKARLSASEKEMLTQYILTVRKMK